MVEQPSSLARSRDKWTPPAMEVWTPIRLCKSTLEFFPIFALKLDLRSEHLQKFGEPIRMSRPCRRGDQPAVHVGLVHWNIYILAARTSHIRPHRRISGAGFAPNNSGCRQYLWPVADGCNGLVCLRKVLHDLQHGLVQAKVFRCAPTGDNQRVIFFSLDLCKSSIQSKVVARLSL